jgi:hypothetical protein
VFGRSGSHLLASRLIRTVSWPTELHYPTGRRQSRRLEKQTDSYFVRTELAALFELRVVTDFGIDVRGLDFAAPQARSRIIRQRKRLLLHRIGLATFITHCSDPELGRLASD